MAKLFKSSMMWGLLLILVGCALLIQNMFDLPILDLLWGLAAAIFGVGFLFLAWKEPGPWWRWLAGAGLVGLSLSALLDFFLPRAAKFLDGAEFLGSLAVGFLLIYLFQRIHWWAIIPAGVLATVSVVTLIDSSGLGVESGSVFFIGLGLTFILVGLLPEGRQRWGFIPGGILIVFGLLLALQAGFLVDILWPVGLILGGGYLIFRALRASPDKPVA